MLSYVVFISRRAMTIQGFTRVGTCILPEGDQRTTGTDGLVPTLLFYGSMPRFRAVGLDARLQPNSERFRCMAPA
jgi:hypothetical protein